MNFKSPYENEGLFFYKGLIDNILLYIFVSVFYD